MKQINIFFLVFTLVITSTSANDQIQFSEWKKKFKTLALANNVSEKTFDKSMSAVKFLPKVIEYDRFQPEFYEDTFTYIKKRSSNRKLREGLDLYKKEKLIIETIEKDFDVEKELLLALMGIETNFGKYLGKMDIVSSLATLSFDKRRSAFFTEELLILLKLVEKKIISKDILYGSWAGAFGNFQFMPRTIRNYAIDYNNNKTIELKNIEDSFASAANYLKTIGWKKNQPCFFKIELKDNIPKKYLNSSNINKYKIISKESGKIPMTCFPFFKKNSKNILNIGSAGGWSKPSTGYTFKNIDKHTTRIVDFLKRDVSSGIAA